MLLLGAVIKIFFEDNVSSMLKKAPNQKGGYRFRLSSTNILSPHSVDVVIYPLL